MYFYWRNSGGVKIFGEMAQLKHLLYQLKEFTLFDLPSFNEIDKNQKQIKIQSASPFFFETSISSTLLNLPYIKILHITIQCLFISQTEHIHVLSHISPKFSYLDTPTLNPHNLQNTARWTQSPSLLRSMFSSLRFSFR